MNLREGLKEDGPALIELVDGVYREYGDQIFLEGADADLLDIEAAYQRRGGAFVVLEEGNTIIGSHATLPLDRDKGLLTFRRLYLRKDYRGRRVGHQLMTWALEWARDNAFQRVEFWSDVRFGRAHRFFEAMGFEKGEVRQMEDGFMPYEEFHFARNV